MTRLHWKSSLILSGLHFDPDLPCWQDYAPFLQCLAGTEFPACDTLNTLLPEGLRSAGGHAIRFVASNELGDDGYEHRIYTTGQVSTRPRNWHDLFNALVWMRYPHIKSALNALHYQAGAERKSASRGPLRDALTLFDECGAVVLSDRRDILDALARRRWRDAFLAEGFDASVMVSVIGHATLEKSLAPYKSMCANVLFVQAPAEFLALTREQRALTLDRVVAELVLKGGVLRNPACLSPLPLAGVPGWWPRANQDEPGFYLDLDVFRPPPANLAPAPIHLPGWTSGAALTSHESH